MNKIKFFIHPAVNLIVFAFLFYTLKDPVVSVLTPLSFFISREQAQAEYRFIESNGRNRKNAGGDFKIFLGSLKPSSWNKKSILDLVFSVSTGVIILSVCKFLV